MQNTTPQSNSALIPDTHNRDYPMYDDLHPTEVAYHAKASAIRLHLEAVLGVTNGVPIDLWPHLALTPIAETVDENLYVRNVAVSQVVPFLPPAEKANGTAFLDWLGRRNLRRASHECRVR